MMQPDQQQEFTERLGEALSWMQGIQERLKANDNTQGPRDALEARLRETEQIHQSEHEGCMKMEKALVLAENLLQSADEELRNHVHAELKDLKNKWEETSTYITHCHSRIEWVWLHWNEYLKAYEEFQLWLTKQQCSLDVRVELQLGLKEKLWQVDQQRVVLSDIHGQTTLLERLLDEAAALYNRTQDPSVDTNSQERLQKAYNDVSGRAEERLSLLQKIAEEHQMHQGNVQTFQSWLLSKTKELTDLMEKEDSGENKLKSLQALDDTVASEEKTLHHIEAVAEQVKTNSSPAGAEVVVEEAEELRLGWQRLRQGLCEAEEGLRLSLNSHGQYVTRCQRLAEDIGRLRLQLQGLDNELENSCEPRDRTDCTEEQMVGQWRKYTGVRNTLAGEESQVELLKAQLKELFRFSEDSHYLSDDVLAVVKEHQSVKSRATRLCSESESELRHILQDPLLFYTQWQLVVTQVLEASAEVTDLSHISMMVQNIENLLKGSVQLKERLGLLQVKGELLNSVFGPERSDGLQCELTTAIQSRELLHEKLLERRNRLQGLLSRCQEFDNTYKLICCKLNDLRHRLVAADTLQPDILAKKSQSDQFRVIQKDLKECESNFTALENLVSSSQSNKTQFERLYVDWNCLLTKVKLKVNESEESIADHENFHENLLTIEKWLMIMKQKLESFHNPSGEWSKEGRRNEAERALEEFPEKQLQMDKMDIQMKGVLKKTSKDGCVHIQRDMTRLEESWKALKKMIHNNESPLDVSTAQAENDSSRLDSLPKELGLDERDSHVKIGEKSQGGQHQGQPNKDYGTLESSGLISEKSLEGKTRAGIIAGHLKDSKELGESQGGGAFLPFRRDPSNESLTTPNAIVLENTEQYTSRKRGFEAWLSKENELLLGILSTSGAPISAKELKIQQDTLKNLKRRVAWGQEEFQLLLQESYHSKSGSGSAEDLSLEELRYRWMLYKSKLKDARVMRARNTVKRVLDKQEEPVMAAKLQKSPGLLKRVCRLALLLWLLLLALLLLAFLLPLMDEGNSCSLSNNFARSFNIMLRYDGPPPT